MLQTENAKLPSAHMLLSFVLCTLTCSLFGNGNGLEAAQPAKAVLVKVNGSAITEQDLQLQFLTRQIPTELQAELRTKFLNDLVEQQLVKEYLKEHRIKLNRARVQEALSNVYKIIREAKREPNEVLSSLGLNEAMLKKELMLPLAWQVHLEEQVTPEKLQRYFELNRTKFDGTELRVSQVFLKANTEDKQLAAIEKMKVIAKEIEQKKISFAAAARKYSQAPTAAVGGDLGFIPYSGKMPTSFTEHLFDLKVGELSEPFVSPFGVHLAQVQKIKQGELSLEDVRTEVWAAMSENVWNKVVAARKQAATIEWIK